MRLQMGSDTWKHKKKRERSARQWSCVKKGGKSETEKKMGFVDQAQRNSSFVILPLLFRGFSLIKKKRNPAWYFFLESETVGDLFGPEAHPFFVTDKVRWGFLMSCCRPENFKPLTVFFFGLIILG